ncbi:MAG TPA: T9SS type A sorting domain-containing protein, partial [Saprospiraceae bacterium]|nr:T9SS type A sorting domain-containing protein [Saprospiraceae bacterium]
IRDKEFEKCVIEMTLPSIDCTSSALDSYQQDLKIMNDNNILKLSTYDNASAKILDIIDIQGKVIPAIFIDELKSSADIHNLYPGVYIVRIQLKDQIINKRFIKF